MDTNLVVEKIDSTEYLWIVTYNRSRVHYTEEASIIEANYAVDNFKKKFKK